MDNKNDLAYKIGRGLAVVTAICITAIVVALTVKFIMWIL